jgi:hypothetical protein
LFDPSEGKISTLGLGIIFIIAYTCLICLALGVITLALFPNSDIHLNNDPETPSKTPNIQQITPGATHTATNPSLNTIAPYQKTPSQQEIDGLQLSPTQTTQ